MLKQVIIIGPNLGRDLSPHGETFHVHASGCADLVRYRDHAHEAWAIEAATADDVGDAIYEDHIAEGSMQPGEGAADCRFFPCTGL